MATQVGPGRLNVIVGPMFAAKSRRLVEEAQALVAAGYGVMIVKPSMDTRQHGVIRSRDGAEYPAHTMADHGLFALQLQAYPVDWLLIDEAHMFQDGLLQTVATAQMMGTHVLAAGVDFNYQTRPFRVMAELLLRADQVIRHFARCGQCDAVAWYTRRKGGSTTNLLVGDSELYEPVCPACMSGEHGLVVEVPPCRR